MNSLINTEAKDILVRSFTIFDFTQAIRELNNSTPKKKIMELFRALDTEANGTLDTIELLKLWLRGK
jgi:Ca2+-binding EF-hand superfamily protein